MKKALQYHNCFVCGKDSPNGLKVDFEICETGARARFIPSDHFEGFKGVVHGGILCALLDEIMWKAINGQHGVIVMTAKMEVRFKKPVKVGTTLVVEGTTISQKKKFYEARGVITDTEGVVLAEATGLFIQMDEASSKSLADSLI